MNYIFLYYSYIVQNFYIVKLLIERGCDLNIQDKYGKTALIYSVEYQIFNIVKLLIKQGCDLNIIDKDGINALQYAVKIEDDPEHKIANYIISILQKNKVNQLKQSITKSIT
jgi:ankyrin repeat protein